MCCHTVTDATKEFSMSKFNAFVLAALSLLSLPALAQECGPGLGKEDPTATYVVVDHGPTRLVLRHPTATKESAYRPGQYTYVTDGKTYVIMGGGTKIFFDRSLLHIVVDGVCRAASHVSVK